MKKILSCILITMIFIIGCNDGLRNNNNDNKGGGNELPTPPTPPNIKELNEQNILEIFGIQKGGITASFAAKKIAKTTTHSSTDFTFTEIRIISYDDETGEFKLQFKGTKKDGSSFDKVITFTQFTYPLKDKMIQSLNEIELSLDEGIEHNYSLDKFIEKLNENIKGKTMLKKLSFMLNDGATIIELGEHINCTLIASAEKDGSKIWIKPVVVYLKLLENMSTETQKPVSNLAFNHLKTELTKDYFTKIDVFNYILSKIDETKVIKGNKNEFASSFYVFAKVTNGIPHNIFTDDFKTQIKHYHDLYEEKDENEHLKLDISYGIYQPKDDGVVSDDYKGDLKINLCLATNDEITNQSGIVVMKTIEKRNGFASIPDDEALGKKTHLFFNLIEKNTLTSQLKEAWEKKVFDKHSLLRVDESGVKTVDNPFSSVNIPFHLCVNSGDTDPSTHLGCAMYGASKTRNEKVIFIERIILNKLANSKSMDVLVILKGTNPKQLKMTVEPY
ncbi:MAG: hypothetical protein ACTTJ6_03810 [Treponema sp.]